MLDQFKLEISKISVTQNCSCPSIHHDFLWIIQRSKVVQLHCYIFLQDVCERTTETEPFLLEQAVLPVNFQ